MTAWPLRLLRWAYVAFIAAASATTLQHAMQGQGEAHHSALFVLLLAAAELGAALAFLIEPVEIVACATLVFVYLTAGAVSVVAADFLAPVRFLYFAATAIFIVVARRRDLAPAMVRA